MSETNQVRYSIAGKNSFLIFALLFNTLTWFYLTAAIISNVSEGLAFFCITIVVSGIFGSTLSNKLQTLRFFYFWVFLGIVSSLSLVLYNGMNVNRAPIISLFLGFSFGVGMPSLLTLFGDFTNIENRGRSAGIVFLAINVSAPIFAVLVKTLDLTTVSIISAIWRGFALIMLFPLKTPKKVVGIVKTFSFSSIFQDRAFILYFVAWMLFCFIDNFEKLILGNFLEANFYSSMLMIEAIIGSIFGLVGGWLCDFIGRKRVVIYGFVTLGLAYAIISITPATISWYLYFVMDGISLGMLWVAFFFVLWADLSQLGNREKYYAVGSAPYFLAILIRVIFALFVAFPAYATFSLASFFLFLAVLPLMYAPETLPEKKIELRRLKKYVEEARKVKEKRE